MKATPITKLRIPARSIAEMSWGTGGTSAYKCNRKGAYYYSCSGHGGYIVDSRCLTKRERAKIDKHVKPINLRLLVQRQGGNGHKFVIGISMLNVPRSGRWLRDSSAFRYIPRLGPVEWQDLPVYLFEEDCDWAVLEKLTDIRAELKWTPPMTLKRRQKLINESFNRWHGNLKTRV